jgi:predicted ribosomally synthesized peptide with SipW-like signal peptide
MTEEGFNLSRRRVLAGMGAVGAAGAGTGLGTSAFLSDDETFANNTFTTGELNLTVGWEEHYFNGIENTDCDVDVRLVGDGGLEAGEVGFPQRGSPVVAVAEEDLEEFMACTLLEQSDGKTDDPEDGVIALDDVKPGDFGEITICYGVHDNPGYVRLESTELGDDENSVKEAEANAQLEDQTEDDPEDAFDGELGEAIQAALWYDPGGKNLDDDDQTLVRQSSLNDIVGTVADLDPAQAGGSPAWNVGPEGCHAPGVDCEERLYLTDTGGGDSDVGNVTRLFEVELKTENDANVAELTAIFETQEGGNFTQTDAIAATPAGETIYFVDKQSAHLGSYDVNAGTFTDEGKITGLSPNDEVVLAAFSPDGVLYVAGQANDTLYAVDTVSVQTTQSESIDGVDVLGADIVYGSDGNLYLYSSATGKLYTVDPDTGTASAVGTSQDDKGSFTGLAIRDAGTGALVGSSEADDAIYVLDKQDGGTVTEYQMQLSGSDGEYGYGFGDMTVGALCPEFCIALEWWLPIDTGNQVQSDSYSFDLTLRTEQCRHNETPFGNRPG